MYRIIFAILLSMASFTLAAQKISAEQYIQQFKDIAINEMKRSGVPASITLAQGILESESGNSELVQKSNNHFGIKCKNTWSGEKVTHDDDENGECFRAYNNAKESYRDHSDFLRNGKRYSGLFELDPVDYAGWARGLKKAGYATNPRYADILIKNIEKYDLQQYTLIALNKLPETPVVRADAENPALPVEAAETKPNPENDRAMVEEDQYNISSINKTRCVFARKGTSLLAVANKYNISLSKLMEFNDMAEEGLLAKDQPVFLQKKSKTGEREYHIVEPDETLFDVSQKNGMQLKYLMEYNGLKTGDGLKAKTKLFLRPGFKKALNNTDDSKGKLHRVASKEGLYTIARTYHVTVEELRAWNKLESDDLKIGQEIIVSK